MSATAGGAIGRLAAATERLRRCSASAGIAGEDGGGDGGGGGGGAVDVVDLTQALMNHDDDDDDKDVADDADDVLDPAVPPASQDDAAKGALSCSICLEPCALDGAHQVSSLSCGHCFGHACIERWLTRHKKGNGGKCPQCNRRAKVADVRKLFVPAFRAFVDTSEVDAAREELARERAGRIEASFESERARGRLKKLEAELSELSEARAAAARELEEARARVKELEEARSAA
jgi:E3 ubiquitin-protein ligase RFWD3